MPSRDRPRAGRVARAVPRSRGPAGNRVAETDAATDRVPQGIQVRSWGCPFQPFAARGSDAPAGDAPHGRTTLLPLTRRISVRESVGNNVKGRFAVETSVGSRAWVPSERLLVRSVFLGAEAIGHLARRPTGVMQRCGSRGHALPRLQARSALPHATVGSRSRAGCEEKLLFPAGQTLCPARFLPRTFGTECAPRRVVGDVTS